MKQMLITITFAIFILMALWWWRWGATQPQSLVIVAQHGDVKINGKVYRDGEVIPANNSQLTTGEASFTSIRLDDGTLSQVLPNSTLVIAQAEKSRNNRRFKTNFRLNSGEVMNHIPKKSGYKRTHTLTTNIVHIGVRGTKFRVVNQQDTNLLSVNRGRVIAENEQNDVSVAKGFGTVIKKGKAISAPVQLPQAPILKTTAQRIETKDITLRWRASEGVRWKVEVARDVEFLNIVAITETEQQHINIQLPHDGQYFWRVASLDLVGLQGEYSDTYNFLYKYYFVLGRHSLQQLNLQQALAAYGKSEQGYQDELKFLAKTGWEKLYQQQSADAKLYFEALLKLDRNNIDAMLGLAYSLSATSDLTLAKSYFDQVLIDDPQKISALFGIASLEIKRQNYQQAKVYLDQVIKQQRDYDQALELSAMVDLQLGNLVLAKQKLQQALTYRRNSQLANTLLSSLAQKNIK